VPFAYYQRLSKQARRIYDASDAVVRIELGVRAPAEVACTAIQAGLAEGDKRAVGKASQALANAICADRQVPRVEIRVLARRPKDDARELHGLYVREEDTPAVIRVWMRTAERRQNGAAALAAQRGETSKASPALAVRIARRQLARRGDLLTVDSVIEVRKIDVAMGGQSD